MKKLLSLVAVSMLSFVVFAGQATLTFADLGFENAADLTTIDAGDVVLSFDKAEGTNAPKYYENGADARLYKGNVLTIEATVDLTSVVFNMTTQGANNYKTVSASTGSVDFDQDAKTLTWTGSAKELVLTVADGQFRSASIDFVADGDITLSVVPQHNEEFEVPEVSEWDFNYVQAVYLSNYYSSLEEPVFEVDFANYVTDNDYTLYLSFAMATESETSIAGVYDLAEDFYWAEVEAVDGNDTATVEFVSGTLTLSFVENTPDGYVYHVVLDAVGDDGKTYKLEEDITFDYIYDAETDEDIEVTDALELVVAPDFVRVSDGQLVVDAEGAVQVYNVSGQMLYNAAGRNTISGIQQGQMLIIHNGNKVAKVVL